MLASVEMKASLMKVVDELPSAQVAEVLDFAMYLRERARPKLEPSLKPEVKDVPIESLRALVGLVSWGGDALEDTEKCYE